MSADNITHVMEQYAAFWRDFAAQAVPAYFKGLIAGGLTREEALALTLGWQNTLVATFVVINAKRSDP